MLKDDCRSIKGLFLIFLSFPNYSLFQIDVLQKKFQRAQEYRNIEVERLQKRRDVYDDKIEVIFQYVKFVTLKTFQIKDIRRTTADSIRKRQRDEAD